MRKHNGFTLIEILVTVVVLAIGLLGLAGLQATALRFNSSAYQRSQATILANDITERMRANVLAARCGAYGGSAKAGLDCTAVPSPNPVAAQDILIWLATLPNSLPSGTGNIVYDGQTGILTISIQWDDSRGQQALQQFVTTTEL